VALHVPVQQPRQTKSLSTGATSKPRRVVLAPHWRQFFTLLLLRQIRNHRVLDAVTTVDEFQMCVNRNAMALLEDEDTLLEVVDAEEVLLFVGVTRR